MGERGEAGVSWQEIFKSVMTFVHYKIQWKHLQITIVLIYCFCLERRQSYLQLKRSQWNWLVLCLPSIFIWLFHLNPRLSLSPLYPRAPRLFSSLTASWASMWLFSLPSVSQSIWPHFLPVAPPQCAEICSRKHHIFRSSAAVKPSVWEALPRAYSVKQMIEVKGSLRKTKLVSELYFCKTVGFRQINMLMALQESL